MFGALLGRKIESHGRKTALDAHLQKGELRSNGFTLSNLRDPALIRLFGGGMTTGSGVDVNETTALSAGAVKQAVRLLSQTMGMLPLHVYERVGTRDKQKQRAPGHPLYQVLHSRPNPEQTRMEFMSMMVGNHVMRGNAVAEIVRDAGGRVRELWPIPSHCVRMERDRQTRARTYWVNVRGEEKKLRADQVLHVPNFTMDGVWGRGLLDDAPEAIGTMIAAERSGANLYANGLQIGGVLSHPGELGEDGQKVLRKSIDDQNAGIGKAGRFLLLEEGMSYTPMGVNPRDAQLIDSRKFGVVEVARHTNLPPHLLMDLDRATFSNIEEQGIQFVTYSLGPFISLFEQRFNVDLLDPRDWERFYCEFNVDGLLRGNIDARYRAYNTAIQAGFMSRNEVRDFEGLAPFDGGDQMLQPLNMTPAGAPTGTPAPSPQAKPGDAPPQDGEPQTRGRMETRGKGNFSDALGSRARLRERFTNVLTKAARQLVGREVRELKKIAAKTLSASRGAAGTALETRDNQSFLNEAEAYYGADYKAQIKQLFGPILEAYANAVGAAMTEEDTAIDFEAFVEDYVGAMADARARDKYAELIQLSKDNHVGLGAALNDVLDGWLTTEPEDMGGRQAVEIDNRTAKRVYREMGVTELRWAANGKCCPICSEMDGRVVGIDKAFTSTGETFDVGEGLSHTMGKTVYQPPMHPGCACAIVAA